MCSYEGKTYDPPSLEVISSKPGRKLRKGTKLKQNKKRSKGTLDLDVTINDTGKHVLKLRNCVYSHGIAREMI